MRTDEWLTPPYVLNALGKFDLDPCSPVNRPWPTAGRHLTFIDDGLSYEWHGRVWLNAPYGQPATVRPWMERMAAHRSGIALVFARTETEMFFDTIWKVATGLLFLEGRLHFHYVNGGRAKNNAGAPSVLVAYSDLDAETLRRCSLSGHYVHNDKDLRP